MFATAKLAINHSAGPVQMYKRAIAEVRPTALTRPPLALNRCAGRDVNERQTVGIRRTEGIDAMTSASLPLPTRRPAKGRQRLACRRAGKAI